MTDRLRKKRAKLLRLEARLLAELVRLARQADPPRTTHGEIVYALEKHALLEHGRFPRDDEKTLTSFVAAAIKKAVEEEREACAKVVESLIVEHFETVRRCGCGEHHYMRREMDREHADTLVAKIRARGDA